VSAPDDKDQRTLPPTEKRKKQFRDRGEIARSKELVGAATMFGGAVGMMMTIAGSSTTLTNASRDIFGQLDTPSPTTLVGTALHGYLGVCLPIIVCALIACVVSIVVQLGSPPLIKLPQIDFARPFSFGGLSGLVNVKANAFRAFTSLLKIVFVGGAAAASLSKGWQLLARDPGISHNLLAAQLWSLSKSTMLTAGGALFGMALFDYVKNKRDLMARMRMTPEEMKKEYKENEGDPHLKGKRKRRARELAKKRLGTTVPTADVVLVNPTEYAVALRYRADEDGAPRVLAKGRGPVAERIREIARKAGVPIIAEPPLCRLIHKIVPEGKEIPGQLFSAVAEVLAYVYRLRGRNR
jgi:flagellar biosynthetic protein FlhB